MAGRIHTKLGTGPGEMAMYRILASLAPSCNDRFATLLLPAAVAIDPGQGALVLPHYDGDDGGTRSADDHLRGDEDRRAEGHAAK